MFHFFVNVDDLFDFKKGDSPKKHKLFHTRAVKAKVRSPTHSAWTSLRNLQRAHIGTFCFLHASARVGGPFEEGVSLA